MDDIEVIENINKYNFTYILEEIYKNKNNINIFINYINLFLTNGNNEELFITLDQCVESIVASKMQCHYCKEHLYLFYKNVREPKQWTLDRIDNDLGHYQSNVVISCLDCNLKRRRTNKDKFLFTKQLKLVKKD